MSDGARTIYEDFDPEAPETTEFRRMLTRIARGGQGANLGTLLVTSAERGEGKTTSASLLALVAALHRGLRTCLVDADLHRPRIAKLFEIPGAPGLAEILGDGLPISSALHPSRHEALKIIPAGRRRPFPSELLVPSRLGAVFTELKRTFHFIVVDAPPLLPVSDPAVLSREVDGVALVVRAGRTQRDVAQRAKKILSDAGANVLGAIVNNADDVLPYYYGHTYYRYGERAAEEAAPADAPPDARVSRHGKGSKAKPPERSTTGSPG
ncbi:MAG: CpsD/CapB family tyrosine-protein kinase [bacterium]